MSFNPMDGGGPKVPNLEAQASVKLPEVPKNIPGIGGASVGGIASSPGVGAAVAGLASGAVASVVGNIVDNAVTGAVTKVAGGFVGGIAGAVSGGSVPAALGGVSKKIEAVAEMPVFDEIAVTAADPKKLVKGAVAKVEGAVAKFVGGIARKLGQKNFDVKVGSGDKLDVRHFSIRERLSTLFQVDLVVVSDNPSINFDDVVGQPAKFSMSAGLHDKSWSGVCNHFEQVRVEPTGVSTYHFSIVPTLWLLTQRKNHRMFQQISEPDIVQKVLEEWGIEPNVRIDKGAYKKRKYRVQYAESDFAFICRMLEDAGISFYFEEEGEETKLVLSDAPQSNEKRAESLMFMDDTSMKNDIHSEFVTAVRMGQRVRPGKYTMRDHDYRKPPTYKLLSSAAKGQPVEEKLERFQYVPGAFLFGADSGEATPSADDKGKARTDEKEGATLAQKRLDAQRGSARVAMFETNAHDLAPGVILSMSGHPHAALADDKALLVVESSLSGAKEGEWSHHCEVRGADVPFRPELVTLRPKVNGVESATVVGPAGEEIHTDEFGRVRVHFHWDRESKMDDNSSCWIHVSQPWGGAGYGATNLPRVGQEVLVDFLGGDPDRPVIVGRVYTNLQKTPYKLPDNKTQSGWKSNSTGGGGGYNELMFEDAKGKELVNMQAEKDLTKLVKNDESVTIGHDRTKTVGHDDTLTVGNDRTRVVGNNETVTIGVNQTFTVGGNHTTTVSGDQKNTVTGSQFNTVKGEPKEGAFCGSHTDVTGDFKMTASKTAFISAPNEIKLVCKGSSITLTPDTITIEAGGKAKIVLNTEALMEAAGGAFVKLNADALAQSKKGSQVKLDADAVIAASTGGYAKCTVDILCSGAKATIGSTAGGYGEFTANADVVGTNASLSGTAKAAVAGAAVNVSASGTNEITGSVVKIN